MSRCRCASRASCATSSRTQCSCTARTTSLRCCSAGVLARSHARIVLDLHGDWHISARLYGSQHAPLRCAARRPARRGSECAVPTACARSPSSRPTSCARKASSPIAEFPAFVDFGLYRERPRSPLPARAALLFVGVLEDYKGIDVLAEAWREAAPRVPDAELRLVGRGGEARRRRGAARRSPAPDAVVPGARPGRAAARARPLDGARAAVALRGAAADRARVVLPRPAGRRRASRRRRRSGATTARTASSSRSRTRGARRRPRGGAPASPPGPQHLAAGAARSASDWLATPEEFAERVRDLVASLD